MFVAGLLWLTIQSLVLKLPGKILSGAERTALGPHRGDGFSVLGLAARTGRLFAGWMKLSPSDPESSPRALDVCDKLLDFPRKLTRKPLIVGE